MQLLGLDAVAVVHATRIVGTVAEGEHDGVVIDHLLAVDKMVSGRPVATGIVATVALSRFGDDGDFCMGQDRAADDADLDIRSIDFDGWGIVDGVAVGQTPGGVPASAVVRRFHDDGIVVVLAVHGVGQSHLLHVAEAGGALGLVFGLVFGLSSSFPLIPVQIIPLTLHSTCPCPPLTFSR